MVYGSVNIVTYLIGVVINFSWDSLGKLFTKMQTCPIHLDDIDCAILYLSDNALIVRNI